MATIGSLVLAVEAQTATIQRDFDRVARASRQMSRQVEQQSALMSRGFNLASAAVRNLAAGIAAGFSAAAIANVGRMGKAAIDAAGNLGELAAQAGVTTRQLQGLELAAVGVGVSQQQLVTSLSQFGVRVGEAAAGTGELKDTLDRYGIAVRDTSGHVRGSVEVLGDLADAVQGAASEQEKLSIVADAFGSRVGPKLLPLLTEGAEGFQKWAQTAEAAGLVMDDKLIAAADRASDSIATLKFAVAKGFEIGIVREFAGAVSVTADNLKAAREAGEAFGRMVGTTMKLGIDAIKSLQPFLGTTAREFRAIFDIVKRLFEFTVTPFAFADEAKKADDAIGPLVVDIHKAVEPTKALAKATGELAGAQKRLAEAGRILLQTSAMQRAPAASPVGDAKRAMKLAITIRRPPITDSRIQFG